MNTHTGHLRADAPLEQREKLRELREQTYLPDEQSPYHGVSHPDRVWEKASLLMERCAEYAIPVDGEALRNAIELHDAYAHISPRMLGFDSAEHLAATITYRSMIDRGYPEAFAAKTHNIVMATNPDVRPLTPEEIIIRAADLWNIGSTYDDFKTASLALHEEAQLAKRKEIPFAPWLRGSFLYLERVMWPMLELTPESKDDQGRSVFHTNALRNMATLWRETLGDHTPVTVEFFPSGTITTSPHDPGEFYIALHPDEARRKESLAELAGTALACDGAAFAAPGERGAFPLPTEFCSKVVCHDPSIESLREALRITRRGGVIVVDLPDPLDYRLLEVAQPFRAAVAWVSTDGAPKMVLSITKEPVL